MSRVRLDNRRPCETVTFQWPRASGRNVHATAAWGDDGQMREIFIHAGDTGSDLWMSSISASVAVSLALQHGARVTDLRSSLPLNSHGRPADVIGEALAQFDDLQPLEDDDG
jgi:hypothetical protein